MSIIPQWKKKHRYIPLELKRIMSGTEGDSAGSEMLRLCSLFFYYR